LLQAISSPLTDHCPGRRRHIQLASPIIHTASCMIGAAISRKGCHWTAVVESAISTAPPSSPFACVSSAASPSKTVSVAKSSWLRMRRLCSRINLTDPTKGIDSKDPKFLNQPLEGCCRVNSPLKARVAEDNKRPSRCGPSKPPLGGGCSKPSLALPHRHCSDGGPRLFS
jgi:hypothetical protein